MLIDDRRATDDCFEARRPALNKGSHFASIAVADQSHAVAVDRLGLQNGIDAGHDVTIVAAAEVVLVSSRKGSAIAGAAAWIGPQHSPTVTQQKVDPRLICVGISAEWAS